MTGVIRPTPRRRVVLSRRITGSGPPLVLVHGSAADADSFRPLERHLADRFTVVSVDRRGRRGSPDAETYALEDEFEDLVALVESLAEPSIVFGHSFGGNVALGAAMRSSMIVGVVLYEPGHRGHAPDGMRDELERLLAADDRRGAMRLVLRVFSRFPEEWLDDLLDTAQWQSRLAYTGTFLRELRAYDEYDYGDLSGFETPTLLIVGGESPPGELEQARSLCSLLPSARLAVLSGEGHVGPITAAPRVAQEIVAFAAGI